MDEQKLEIERNYARFCELLPQIIAEYRGQYALLKNGEIVRYFRTAQLADMYGLQKYSDGIYSVQEVADVAMQSGAFAHASV